MTRFTTSSVFPDLNVWIALTLSAHQHHLVAWQWYRSLKPDQTLAFCRFTQLGFLRLVTTEQVARHETRNQKGAWAAYDRWIEKGGAVYRDEPLGLDIELRELTDQAIPAPKGWSDSYLAAFAVAASIDLVTFDKALSRKVRRSVLLAVQS
jgi:toxin-antitoxin system PIN domain toxin